MRFAGVLPKKGQCPRDLRRESFFVEPPRVWTALRFCAFPFPTALFKPLFSCHFRSLQFCHILPRWIQTWFYNNQSWYQTTSSYQDFWYSWNILVTTFSWLAKHNGTVTAERSPPSEAHLTAASEPSCGGLLSTSTLQPALGTSGASRAGRGEIIGRAVVKG